ncbi:MAG: chemotaxis protein CheA [Coriobacteriia bacterium]|nr:chemotaxis protein CheA [Coriobacteriia bacterium]
MSDDMSAYRDVFLSESAEYLQAMTEGLLALEAEPNDLEPVETVFRGAHSLKGMAAAMAYGSTQELTHKMESLMDTVRHRVQAADHELIDLMLRAIDVVRETIAAESAETGEAFIDGIVAELVARTTAAPAAPEVRSGKAPAADTGEGALFQARITLEEACVLKGVRAYMAIKRLSHMSTVVETRPSAREIEDERFDRSFEVIFRTSAAPEAVRNALIAVTEVEDVVVEPVAEPAPSANTPDASPRPASSARSVPKLSETQTVRISIGHLDAMVNLVGELVIIRSRLERIARDADLPELGDTLDALERVSAELQQEVMQTRMVPVGNIFNRFPRMVRDLARDLGKDVAFETDGLDIELDRTVLDEIGDPIVHLLRNCVDHGVETPEERVAAGKPERGTVRLAAEREREQIRITVSDDGRGLDVGRIWSAAVARGLVEDSARDSYSEHDIFLFVCAPGFSTVDHATKVSGRGVGMDVVKGKIEYLGGTISITSTPGEGTSISLRLPLTLAIIQALLLACGDQVFAVPLSAVDEVLGLDEVTLKTVEGRWVTVLRDGSVIPIQRLDVVCGVAEPGEAAADPGDHIVIIHSGEEMRALTVPRLIGRQEIVIKPLSALFRGLHGIGGATVLGDGHVALILDPRTLLKMEG